MTMRLLLLPISTRRVLVYCEPQAALQSPSSQTYLDKAVNWANKTWVDWEKSETGWKKKTTEYGNHLFRRIPFEEWGLKSIPPLKKRRQEEYETNPVKMAVEVRYPQLYQGLGRETVMECLQRLATERQSLHQKRMYWSVAGMPLTLPVGLLPIIPNLPFFYLAFRFYSHWCALTGSRHLEFLVRQNLLKPQPSDQIDSLYSAGLVYATRNDIRNATDPTLSQSKQIVSLIRRQMQGQSIGNGNSSSTGQSDEGGNSTVANSTIDKIKSTTKAKAKQTVTEKDGSESTTNEEEIMLLKGWNGKLIAERLNLPGLEIEIERAVEQVEKDLEKGDELQEEKEEIEREMMRTSSQSQKPRTATQAKKTR